MIARVKRWTFAWSGAGDRRSRCFCRSARRWRNSSVTKTLPTSRRARAITALCGSRIIPADGHDGGATWRCAATAPSRRRTATVSKPDNNGLQIRARGNQDSAQHACARHKGVQHMAARPLIVFDVNETLLDLETMEPTFRRIFGDNSAMRLWFANFIMYSASLTVAGCYVPFTDIGSAVMKMLADTRGIRIGDDDKKELTEKFSTMPPYPEVPAALRKLRNAGFRLFCLTDNLLEVQTRQLEHGGIADLFERRFSADGVKYHKPSRQAYGHVEKELGVQPSQLFLIACHTWDTLGAVAAGW